MGWIQRHFRKFSSAEAAQSALSRYRMGMKAGGAIRGVRVSTADDGCPACRRLAGEVYGIDDAPALPVRECSHELGCRCAYRPVMEYED